MKFNTVEEAFAHIKSCDRVFVHGGAATPHYLIQQLIDQNLHNVELVSMGLEGEALFSEEKYKSNFRINSVFVSANVRKAINEGRGDYIPIFLSEVPNLFRSKEFPIDVALVQVSPPDQHGYCSLGTSVDIAATAVKNSKYVIAQINSQMPRTFGDGIFHINDFHATVYHNQELSEIPYKEPSEIFQRIGNFCAELVEDGATLQMGIGSIPDAVLNSLQNHKDLGIHTEMFSDGVIPLLEKGVINNKFKKKYKGKSVTAFVLGSRKLYDYIDDNPGLVALNMDYVNDTSIIRSNPKVTAINSAIEVDLTGQVCSDSIGTYEYSGVGGQMDFMRGAALSEGGKPIIALSSTTLSGVSKIVPFLKEGAGVVTTRAHAYYIVTEYGIASLFGKNLRQRTKALIDIAHPNYREMLEKAAFERFKTYEFERTYYM
jgi:acyl-CoA hydrolase